MNKPKVLFITERYWPAIGGIEEGAKQMVRLLKEKYDISVLTMRNSSSNEGLFGTTSGLRVFEPYYDLSGTKVEPLLPDLLGRLIMLPIMLRHFPCMRRLFPRWCHDRLYFFFRIAMKHKMAEHIKKCGLIACFSGGYLGILVQEICEEWKIPNVFFPSVHPGAWNDSPKAMAAYGRANAIVPYLNSTVEHLQIIKEKINVISLPISEYEIPNPKSFRDKYNIHGPMILFIGRRDTHKGLSLLFQTSGELVKKCPSARLVIIGPDGNAFSLPKPPWCIDLGRVDEDLKREALSACDILCVPSTSESLGLVYLEAWYNRKPVIACNTPEARELVEHEKDGLLVEPNTQSLLKALEKLVGSSDECKIMGQNGYEKYQRRFSNSVVAGKIIKLFDEMLK